MHSDQWEICPSARRWCASLNDIGIWLVFTWPIWFIIWANSFGVGSVTPAWAPLTILTITLASIFMELFLGNSFGKYAVGVRVLTSDGQLPIKRQLIIRWITKYVPCASISVILVLEQTGSHSVFPTFRDRLFQSLHAVALCAQAISLITALVGPRRALHDLLAGTMVMCQVKHQPRGFPVILALQDERRVTTP